MDELPTETKEQVFRALGEAVVAIWSRLPQDIQHDLFEGAVTSQGEFQDSNLQFSCMGSIRALPTLLNRAQCQSRTASGVRCVSAPFVSSWPKADSLCSL